MKQLLELKKKIAKKRPRYLRSDAHRRKCIPQQWRQPKGMHSKIRLKRRGKISQPGQGVASPKAVRGLTMQGMRPIEVSTARELERIDPKTQAIVLRRVGQRKRIEILKQALAKKITILNIRKPEELIKQAEEEMQKIRESKKKKEETKKKRKEEAVKKAEENKKEGKQEESEEKPETAKGAKSEKIKTLEKRQ